MAKSKIQAVIPEIVEDKINAITSPSSQHELNRLEAKVRTSFIEGARALKEINEKKLYLIAGYTNFENYCMERFAIGRSLAYLRINGFKYVDHFQNVKNLPADQLPTSERQTRAFVKERLELNEAYDLWVSAIKSNNRLPSGPDVEYLIRQRKVKVEYTITVGDYVQISRLALSESARHLYGECVGVNQETEEVELLTAKGLHTVRLSDAKPIKNGKILRNQIERLSNLPVKKLDPSSNMLFNYWSHRAEELTPMEFRMLDLIEDAYRKEADVSQPEIKVLKTSSEGRINTPRNSSMANKRGRKRSQ